MKKIGGAANKENVALITSARCQASFEKSKKIPTVYEVFDDVGNQRWRSWLP
jgi:hypothetical protein